MSSARSRLPKTSSHVRHHRRSRRPALAFEHPSHQLCARLRSVAPCQPYDGQRPVQQDPAPTIPRRSSHRCKSRGPNISKHCVVRRLGVFALALSQVYRLGRAAEPTDQECSCSTRSIIRSHALLERGSARGRRSVVQPWEPFVVDVSVAPLSIGPERFQAVRKAGSPEVRSISCQFEHLFFRVVGLQFGLGMTLVDALEGRDQAEKRCFRLRK
jgi:hypothetical protein